MLKDKQGFRASIDLFVERFKDRGIDHVVGIEARGYIFGAPIAYAIGAGFIPVRKPGKLPYEKISEEYALEYGTNALEIHSDALVKGDKVLSVTGRVEGWSGRWPDVLRKLPGEPIESTGEGATAGPTRVPGLLVTGFETSKE